MNYEKFEPRLLLSASAALNPIQELLILEHIASIPETAYLQQGHNDLAFVAAEQDGTMTTSIFQQTVYENPVHGAYITVVQENGKFTGVYDRGFEKLDSGNLTVPMIRGQSAEVIAEKSLGEIADLSHSFSTTDLVWYHSDDVSALTWQVSTFLGMAREDGSTADYLTFVDAHSGELISQQAPYELIEYLLENPEVEVGVFPRIVVRDSMGIAGGRAYGAPFDAVVEVGGVCTGILIASNTVLTARHCGANTGTSIVFGDNSNNPTFVATVQTRFNPAGNNGSLLGGGDVSILTLTGNIPANIATPMRLIAENSSLVGQVIAMVGYGYNGLGSQGHGFDADGFRWGGENILDRYGTPSGASGSNIFSTDFDSGSQAHNTIPGSDPNPLEFEATTAPGDSGGPILARISGGEWVIAGVLSGGTTATSVYGDISWWTGIAPYQDAIEDRGGEFVGQGFSGTIAPENLNIILGEVNGGNIGSLEFSDNSRLELAPDESNASASLATWIELTATSPELAPNQLAFRLEGNANTFNLAQNIGIFNYNSGFYELVESPHVTVNIDGTVDALLSGDLSRFVDDATGEMKTRLTWGADGPLQQYPWSLEVDQAVWLVNVGAGPLPLKAGGDATIGISELDLGPLVGTVEVIPDRIFAANARQDIRPDFDLREIGRHSAALALATNNRVTDRLIDTDRLFEKVSDNSDELLDDFAIDISEFRSNPDFTSVNSNIRLGTSTLPFRSLKS